MPDDRLSLISLTENDLIGPRGRVLTGVDLSVGLSGRGMVIDGAGEAGDNGRGDSGRTGGDNGREGGDSGRAGGD